ncbi:hypothetical protein BTJ49_00375 [Oleiagrimonas sp. MCCC 1A03011]|nr:hypothetical protein [Oleiagrimonas citrea]RAP59184.1 hypothetical protein BTJ49_00375 [Oleiagrimonas sp. MCCC 1A03011]
MTRMMKLGRQLREIENAIFALPAPMGRQVASITARELELASRCDPPWMYGTPPEDETTAWGSGADIGITRVRSDNPQVRMRGIGLWLAVIYHETNASDAPGAADLHRQVMRVVRQLKERLGESTATTESAASDSSSTSAAVA